MGREIRMVPADWQHPKDERGQYEPLLDGSFAEELAEWNLGKSKWSEGLQDDYNSGWKPSDSNSTWEEWAGVAPEEAAYMPTFAEGTATHLMMMYETCTEGTPISPAFATPEELAHWLADTNASAFGAMGASYESW